MFTELVLELLQKYEVLETAGFRFGDAVRADEGLPLLLPEYGGIPDREAAISAMTQTRHLKPSETLARTGVVCCSPATIREAENLNDAKAAFQAAIKSVRDSAAGEKSRLDKLIDRVLLQQNEAERHRAEELQLALKRAQINRLDLLRCYARIRVMPKHLRSISWTWARTHSVIDPVSREEAIKQAENLGDKDARESALSLLAKLTPGRRLVYKKNLPNQLRANLLWDDDEEGVVKRKSVTISGIVLSQNSSLPSTWVWRDDPGGADPHGPKQRVTRLDARIEPEPYIRVLHLHLYTGDGHGK